MTVKNTCKKHIWKQFWDCNEPILIFCIGICCSCVVQTNAAVSSLARGIECLRRSGVVGSNFTFLSFNLVCPQATTFGSDNLNRWLNNTGFRCTATHVRHRDQDGMMGWQTLASMFVTIAVTMYCMLRLITE
jgi:hypothetical protein